MKTDTEKKMKPSYSRISDEAADRIFLQIIDKIGLQKAYKDRTFTATKLAKDLHTNTRYISVVIARHTGSNFNALVNSYRLRDACRMLRGSKWKDNSVEEIGLMCGFSTRQSFYTAFHREKNITPKQYRLLEKVEEE